MSLPVSMTHSSQNSVSARTDFLVKGISSSTAYLTEKASQDINASCTMQEEIGGSRDNFASAIQAIQNLTGALDAICESSRLLRGIVAEAHSLTMKAAAESVELENAKKV